MSWTDHHARPLTLTLTLAPSAKWPGLLPELVGKFSQQDLGVIQGVLSTANEIFKKFRYAHPSDELYTDLQYCLKQFQEPLLQLFQMFSATILPTARDKTTRE